MVCVFFNIVIKYYYKKVEDYVKSYVWNMKILSNFCIRKIFIIILLRVKIVWQKYLKLYLVW